MTMDKRQITVIFLTMVILNVIAITHTYILSTIDSMRMNKLEERIQKLEEENKPAKAVLF